MLTLSLFLPFVFKPFQILRKATIDFLHHLTLPAMPKWCLIILLIGLFMSCNDIEDCQTSPYRETVLINWNYDGLVIFDSILVAGIGRLGGDRDTLNKTEAFGFPLDLESNNISYEFFTDSVKFELNLTYDKQIIVFELDCDASIRYFNLDTLSTNNFDSVAIRFSELFSDIEDPINIEIYL